MAGRSLYHLVFYSLCFMFCIAESNAQETRAVRWEFFKDLKMTWTEVSKFCLSKNGHMVTPNTSLAMHALRQQIFYWFKDWTNSSRPFSDFWMGLFNCNKSNTSPDKLFWEKDNSQLGKAATIWKSEFSGLKKERCIRVHLQENKTDVVWRDLQCNKCQGVVCEYDEGDCIYEALPNKTMKPQHGMWFQQNVTDLSICWDLCLHTRVNGTECVAAVFSNSSGLPGECLMSLGDRLLETSDVDACDRVDSTVLLRRCFNGSVNSSEQLASSSGGCSKANLTEQSCPGQLITIQHDNYSSGAKPLSKPELISLDAFTCTASATSLSLPPSTSLATSSSVPPATLSLIVSIASPTTSLSGSPATSSPRGLRATSSTVSQATSSNMSRSTSSTPTAAVSSTSSLNKSSSVLPATSSTASRRTTRRRSTASLNTTSSSAAPATLSTWSLPISPDSSSTSSNTRSWVSQATSSIASLTSASASLTSSLSASPTTSPSVSPPAASVSTKSTASPIKPADLSSASTATSSTVPLITFLTGSSNTSSPVPEVTSLIGSSHQTSSLPPAPTLIELSNTSSSIASAATSSPQPSRTSSFVPQTTSPKEPFAPQNTSSTESSNTPRPTSTSSTEFSNKSEQLPTTSISLAESSIAPSPLSPTSSTQGISLTTDHALNASAAKLPTGTTTQKKCPCVCRFKGNGSLPSLANTPEDHRQQLLIPVKEMSKYRRSKTSVYVERKSNPFMSVAYIIFMCFLVLCILLCDLTRIRKCRSCDKNRRSRVGLSSVEKA